MGDMEMGTSRCASTGDMEIMTSTAWGYSGLAPVMGIMGAR